MRVYYHHRTQTLSFAPFIISRISVTMVSIRDLPYFVFASLAYTIGYRSLYLFAPPTEKYFTLRNSAKHPGVSKIRVVKMLVKPVPVRLCTSQQKLDTNI